VTAANKSKESLVESAGSYGKEICEGIPFVGSVVSFIDSILDSVYTKMREEKYDYKITAISRIISEKATLEEDISPCIAKAALEITRAKSG
jgi:hypothetical protein